MATAAVGISPKTWSRWLTEDAAFRTVVRATVAKARISASCQLKAAFLEQLRLGHDFYTAAARAGLCWRTAYQWREQDAEFRHAWKSVYRRRHPPKETPRPTALRRKPAQPLAVGHVVQRRDQRGVEGDNAVAQWQGGQLQHDAGNDAARRRERQASDRPTARSRMSLPKFHNEPASPEVCIGVTQFACIGVLPPHDHPTLI